MTSSSPKSGMARWVGLEPTAYDRGAGEQSPSSRTRIAGGNPGLSLCYVEGPWAYFTTQALDEQWGDDWNDAPYFCNAGRPYEFHEYDREHGREPWTIARIAYDGPFESPETWDDKPWRSVEEINAGVVPWLKTDRYAYDVPQVVIPAGTTFSDFIDLVHRGGGTVYLPLC